jgi:hypothetical protein
MALHSALTGSDLHEIKGAATATSGQIPVANGAGSAPFTTPTLAVTAPDVLATVTEINNQVKLSTRLVAAGATLTLTTATHGGKTILFDTLAGSVVTLPAASGSGVRFRFRTKVLATSNSHIVKVANASDIIQGILVASSDDAGNPAKAWNTAATDDTITLNRTTTGGVVRGEFIELEDIASNLWAVTGTIAQNGTEATPFSATV